MHSFLGVLMVVPVSFVSLQTKSKRNISKSPVGFSRKYNSEISFGRVPTAKEALVMTDAINKSLELLGKKVKILMHGSCFPAELGENTGVGSPVAKGAQKVWKFIKQFGFSGIQEGPIGKTMLYDPSPYNTSATSINELFIDVFDLAGEKWGKLVSKQKLKDLVCDKLNLHNFDNDRETANLFSIIRKETLDKFLQTGEVPVEYTKMYGDNKEAIKKALEDEVNFYNGAKEGKMLEFNLLPDHLSDKGSDFYSTRRNYLGKYTENDSKHMAFDNKSIMSEAYEKFIVNKDKLPELHKEFESFKSANNNWLERDALYESLIKRYGNDYYGNWNKWDLSPEEKDWAVIDKELFNFIDRVDLPEHTKAIERKLMLEKEYSKELDNYKFNQFVLDKQMTEAKELANKQGITRLTDIPIGYTHRDYWANQVLFHAKEPRKVSYSTPWGGYMPHPSLLFKEDGKTLGPAGEFVYRKYSKPLKYYDGFRIDCAPMLYDIMNHGHGMRAEDKQDYAKIYDNIIRPLLKENGMWDEKAGHFKNVVAEALGEFSLEFKGQPAFDEGVLKDIPSIYQPLWGQDMGLAKLSHTALLTSHDQPSFREMIAHPEEYRLGEIGSKINRFRQGEPWSECKSPSSAKFNDYLDYLSDLTGFDKEKMRTDDAEFAKAKFTELFLSKAENIDISFDDFFGLIKKDDIYNIGNSMNISNRWEARLPDNFEKSFYQNLENDEAINMPELFAKVIEKKYGNTQTELLKNLNSSAAILKEKTPDMQKIVYESENEYYRFSNLIKYFDDDTVFNPKQIQEEIVLTPSLKNIQEVLPQITSVERVIEDVPKIEPSETIVDGASKIIPDAKKEVNNEEINNSSAKKKKLWPWITASSAFAGLAGVLIYRKNKYNPNTNNKLSASKYFQQTIQTPEEYAASLRKNK